MPLKLLDQNARPVCFSAMRMTIILIAFRLLCLLCSLLLKKDLGFGIAFTRGYFVLCCCCVSIRVLLYFVHQQLVRCRYVGSPHHIIMILCATGWVCGRIEAGLPTGASAAALARTGGCALRMPLATDLSLHSYKVSRSS